jgi:hypothetical protein
VRRPAPRPDRLVLTAGRELPPHLNMEMRDDGSSLPQANDLPSQRPEDIPGAAPRPRLRWRGTNTQTHFIESQRPYPAPQTERLLRRPFDGGAELSFS